MTNDEFYQVIRSITSTKCSFFSVNARMWFFFKTISSNWAVHPNKLNIRLDIHDFTIDFQKKEVSNDYRTISYEDFVEYIYNKDYSIAKNGELPSYIENNDLGKTLEYIKRFDKFNIDAFGMKDIKVSLDFLVENRITFIVRNSMATAANGFINHFIPEPDIDDIQISFLSDDEHRIFEYQTMGFSNPNDYQQSKLNYLRLYENI